MSKNSVLVENTQATRASILFMGQSTTFGPMLVTCFRLLAALARLMTMSTGSRYDFKLVVDLIS